MSCIIRRHVIVISSNYNKALGLLYFFSMRSTYIIYYSEVSEVNCEYQFACLEIDVSLPSIEAQKTSSVCIPLLTY
jgi:hypothetical protein